jgi:hypothetical protein
MRESADRKDAARESVVMDWMDIAQVVGIVALIWLGVVADKSL